MHPSRMRRQADGVVCLILMSGDSHRGPRKKHQRFWVREQVVEWSQQHCAICLLREGGNGVTIAMGRGLHRNQTVLRAGRLRNSLYFPGEGIALNFASVRRCRSADWLSHSRARRDQGAGLCIRKKSGRHLHASLLACIAFRTGFRTRQNTERGQTPVRRSIRRRARVRVPDH